jgi:3-oxoadipate CoA-transferase beta subunit
MVSISQRGWTAEMIARRVYRDLPDGAYVNLGIGLPNRILGVAHDPEKEVVFHSENGILGLGERPGDDDVDPDLIDSGKNFASLVPGGCFFSHVDSFAMIRGGHIQIAVLGAFEVSAAGDIANWTTDGGTAGIPAIGGAADLAAGAGTVFVMMSSMSRDGIPRLVRNCSLPVTAMGAVSRVYTDLGVFVPEKTNFRVLELAPAVSLWDVQSQLEPGLIQDPNLVL